MMDRDISNNGIKRTPGATYSNRTNGNPLPRNDNKKGFLGDIADMLSYMRETIRDEGLLSMIADSLDIPYTQKQRKV